MRWSEATLAEIASAPIVYGIVQPGPSVRDGIPFVQTRDIGGALRPDQLDRTSVAISDQYQRSMLIAGDLLIALRGSIGATSIAPRLLDGANISRGVARLRVSAEFDADFVRQVLASDDVRRALQEASRGSTLREISIGALRAISVSVPPLPEQWRIAEILRAWDDAIDATERLAVARRHQLDNLTRALVAAVGGRRLPLAHVARPLTTKNAAGETRVLTTSARHGLIDQREYFGKRIASTDLSGYFLLERDDFAYNRSSSKGHPYGAIRRLTAHERGVVSTLNLCFSVVNSRVTSPDYLDYLLSSGYLDDQLVGIAHEGARAHGLLNVSKVEFFELVVPVPDREVQDQVVDVLDTARGEVGLLDHKTALLRAQKRGLMQKLLSGEIRVGVDDD